MNHSFGNAITNLTSDLVSPKVDGTPNTTPFEIDPIQHELPSNLSSNAKLNSRISISHSKPTLF